jgi:molybdopterin-guanine dinucleotide biosynthesis protein A
LPRKRVCLPFVSGTHSVQDTRSNSPQTDHIPGTANTGTIARCPSFGLCWINNFTLLNGSFSGLDDRSSSAGRRILDARLIDRQSAIRRYPKVADIRGEVSSLKAIEKKSDIERGWTAIVLAGERPEGDPLASRFGVPAKALIEIGGKTLLARVVEALLHTPAVSKILILAQHVERLAEAEPSHVLADRRVTLARSGDGIASSVEAVLGTPQAPWPVLITTADNALLTPERVAAFLRQAETGDLAIGFGERSIVETAYPDTKRTWLKLAGGHYSGANLFALRNERCLAAVRHWASVEQDRKKGLKLVASFGPLLLLRVVTRTIGLERALGQVGRKLGFDVRPVVLDADAPIDVDKIEDVELVERIIADRESR